MTKNLLFSQFSETFQSNIFLDTKTVLVGEKHYLKNENM